MASDLTLSVVDQSPIQKGGTGVDALRESVKLVQITERLGYSRYWVADRYGTRDIGIVTNCCSFESRVSSYELVAEGFGLTPRPSDQL